jgi:hypothetical protein
VVRGLELFDLLDCLLQLFVLGLVVGQCPPQKVVDVGKVVLVFEGLRVHALLQVPERGLEAALVLFKEGTVFLRLQPRLLHLFMFVPELLLVVLVDYGRAAFEGGGLLLLFEDDCFKPVYLCSQFGHLLPMPLQLGLGVRLAAGQKAVLQLTQLQLAQPAGLEQLPPQGLDQGQLLSSGLLCHPPRVLSQPSHLLNLPILL